MKAHETGSVPVVNPAGWIFDYSFADLQEKIRAMGLKPYATAQIFLWLYGKNEQDISNWTDISMANRAVLKGAFNMEITTVVKKISDSSKTTKYMFSLMDGARIESVLIPEKQHWTLCLSSQVGCPLGCRFCATGRMGLKRQLSSGEILTQILQMKKMLGDYNRKINLVFMGMGEPLLNYSQLQKALRIITAESGLSISPRNITVSTAGILPGIKNLEADFPTVKISFSLNATTSSVRQEIMPVERQYRFTEVIDYFRSRKRKHRITIEYVLLRGLNDTDADAYRLVKILSGVKSKVNLIPYNPNEDFPFTAPAVSRIEKFTDILRAHGLTVMVRISKGRDIQSACGQLAVYPDRHPGNDRQ